MSQVSPKLPSICWAVNAHGDGIGNAYGYRSMNVQLACAVAKIVPLRTAEEAAHIVWVVSPDWFDKNYEGKINWLFTMFEGHTLPEIYVKNINANANYIIAPSNWVADLFRKYFDPSKVFVVPLGVSGYFKYKKRKFPHRKPFRVLWVGAPNPRKGYEEIIYAWKHSGLENMRQFELYIKTTRVGKLECMKNVIMDGRDIHQRDLIKLYHSAHCFLFPTRGEGFGLTLAEAMATGLPCIAPSYSGVADFFDNSVGYEIGYELGKSTQKFIREDIEEHETTVAFPYVDEMVNQLVHVANHYKEALAKGKRASLRIRTQFTWEKSAMKLIDLIGSYDRKELAA